MNQTPSPPPSSPGGDPLPPASSPSGGEAPPPSHRRLVRKRGDRVVGGVCAGVAEYLGVEVLIVRIVAVASIFLAGLGLLLYLGALLLVPDEDGQAYGDTTTTRGRILTALGVVALVGAAAVVLSGAVLGSLAVVVPLAVIALVGLVVWWLVSGDAFEGDWKAILKRSALGLGVLLLCAAVFVSGGWATAAGGGAVVAALVIAAGVALLAGAFFRPVRWLVLPAVSLGLGVGFVSAAGIDLDGGVGDRTYRPAQAADIRDRYELGAGSLIVDLRNAELPKGDVPVNMDLGMGEARLIVPADVCVASRAKIGMGEAVVFDRESGGIDVDVEELPTAPPAVTRVVVDADIGLGAFEVAHDDRDGRRWGRDGFEVEREYGNRACTTRERPNGP
jgi:phage shock protein PspC (stress-responsive transcriptional regulator)